MNKKCIGIDLGTTNSELGVIVDEKVQILQVDGSILVPSVVSLDNENNILVGMSALNNQLIRPKDTIRWIKRKMGQETLVSLGDKEYTPEMISSMILSKLKKTADDFYKENITQAVITVPAFFNERQREAVKKAGELAGLEVLRLLNEPTAAALAYTLGNRKDETCLVYDLGGGTFDVSIVNLSSDIMEVLASEGDTQLGGADFDILIAEEAKNSFLKEHGIDLSKDAYAWTRLLIAAEKAKITLSTEGTATMIEQFIYSKDDISYHLKYTITKNEFEEMIRPILQRTIRSVKKALEESERSSIDRFILVGGSTHIPLVSQMIEEEFKIIPQAYIDPTIVVAQGAAIEAYNHVGGKIGSMMVDITPHSLGIGALNKFEHIKNCFLIKRNATLPAVVSRIFYKAYPEQSKIHVSIYQGESEQIERNLHIGDIVLDNLGYSENLEVCVKFELDKSGLLNVTTTDLSSNKSAKVTIHKKSKSRIENKDLTDLKQEKKEEKKEDPKLLETTKQKLNEKLITEALAFIEGNKLSPIQVEEIKNEIEKYKNGDVEAERNLEDLLYYLK